MLGMSGVAIWNLRTQRVDADWVQHTERVRFELSRILQLLIDAQTEAREYVLLGSDRALKAYGAATPLIDPSIEDLSELISDNLNQRPRASRLAGIAHNLKGLNDALLSEAQKGDTAQVRSLLNDGRIDEAMEGARTLLAAMQGEENRLLIERRDKQAHARRDAAIALWATGALGASLLVLAVYFTRQESAKLYLVERELATTLRSVGDAVIATDLAGVVRFMNPIAEQLTGWTESSARGQPLTEVFRIIGEESRASVESPARLVLQEGRRVALANHTILISKDGTERAIADSGAPVVDEHGKIQGIVLVFRDVSEDRRVERTLRLRDTELQIVNDYAQFPIAHCDRQHHYLFVNKAYAARLGVKPEDCVGKHIGEVAGEPAYQSVLPYINDALEGKAVEFETEIPYGGSYGSRWMRCIYAPVRDAEGMVRSFVAAVTDITDRKHAEAELRRSQLALQETDRRKDEFIATLSHELRNPLAPIRTAAKIIASAHLAPDQLERAQMIIERQVTHMALLLDDLLDIARITQGKLRLKKEPVALSEVAEAAMEAARPLLDEKSHRVSVKLPAEAVWLEADPLRLAQILSNLLINAGKYSNPGSHIEVEATHQAGKLSISVKDNGLGLAPESINGIFEMFSQIEGVEGRSEGGLGIGLALVKGLTELHGGTVEARSAGLGQGSEFIVQLPASKNPPSLPRVSDTAQAPAQRRRVLIVDDNRDAAESLSMLLELSGHEVRVAHLGSAALTLAQSLRPDIALLDIGMPDLSGYEVARALRLEPWATDLQLIALTGWGQDEDRRRALEAGFDYHLTKPIDLDQLQRLMASRSAAAS
jgi:PAS domain S-box-containing protein